MHPVIHCDSFYSDTHFVCHILFILAILVYSLYQHGKRIEETKERFARWDLEDQGKTYSSCKN